MKRIVYCLITIMLVMFMAETVSARPWGRRYVRRPVVVYQRRPVVWYQPTRVVYTRPVWGPTWGPTWSSRPVYRRTVWW